MEENINWNMASNSQLKEECERLEKEFNENQALLKEGVEKIGELNAYLKQISQQYVEIKQILNKREGKNQ